MCSIIEMINFDEYTNENRIKHNPNWILSMYGWLCIKFSNAFDFPVPEPPIINILYGWSGI